MLINRNEEFTYEYLLFHTEILEAKIKPKCHFKRFRWMAEWRVDKVQEKDTPGKS